MPKLDQIRLNWAGHKATWRWFGLLYLHPKLFEMTEERLKPRSRLRVLLSVLVHLSIWNWLIAFFIRLGVVVWTQGLWEVPSHILSAAGLASLSTALGLALGLAGGLAFGLAGGLAFGLAVGLAVGLALGFALGFGLAVGLAFGLALGLASGLAVSLASGLAFGLAFGLASGLADGLAFGLGMSLGYWLMAFRFHYWLWPQILRHVQPVTDLSWRGHPVVWDRACSTPLWYLDRFLVSVSEYDRPAGWRLVRRLIRQNQMQRPAALNALVALTARTAARAEDLDQLPRLLAELPSGEEGWLQSSDTVKATAEGIANLWRNAAAAKTHYARKLRLDEVIEELDRFRGQVSAMPDPLAAEFLRAADAWTATTQRQMSAIPAEVPPFFENAETVIRPDTLAFLRRDTLLSEMERLLTLPGGGSGVLLYARKRMGKSTLLENLKPLVSKDLAVAYISMQSAEAFTSTMHWAAHVTRTSAKACPEAAGLTEAHDLAGLATFLRELDARLSSAGRRLLIALDEYEVIDEKIGTGQLSADILMQIRAAIQHHRQIRWLISGVHHFSEMKHGDWASTFSACQMVEVSPFTAPETHELLTEPLKYARAFGARQLPEQSFFKSFWKPGMIEAIHEESQGWPALVQGLAREVCRACNERSVLEPDEAMLEPAFNRACSSLNSTLATLLLEQETKEPARSASQWLRGFRTAHELTPPADEAVRDLLRRHELIADLHAPLWRLRVPLMQRYLEIQQ